MGDGRELIRSTRSGSAARRWRRARSISPEADKGFMIIGKTLADCDEFLLLFLLVVAAVVVESLKTVRA